MQDEPAEKSTPTDASETAEQSTAGGDQENQETTDPTTAEPSTAGVEAAEVSATTSPAISESPAESSASVTADKSGSADNAEPARQRRQIKIGSRQQRPVSEATTTGSESQAAAPEITDVSTSPTPLDSVPTVRDPLPADLEQEIQEALENTNLDEIVASELTQQAGETLAVNSTRRATVIRVHGDHVFFSLSGPHEGAVSIRQFKESPTVGDQLDVIIQQYNSEDGLYELRLPGAAVDVNDWSDLQDGTVVEARITGANTGGLECMVNNIRGFIPASQIGIFRVEDFAQYIDKKLSCVVTEVNRRRRNLVLSHRAVLERQAETDRKELLATLAVGQTLEGTVRNIRDFGAFVDIGGIDGLVHISQLSWDRVEHPKDVVKKGETVKVRIEKINLQTGKIALSCRALLDHPWKKAAEQFPVGNSVEGTVTRIADFGAFVRLSPGVEGLIHISELAHHRVSLVNSIVNEGDQVLVEILAVDADAQRISLSLKALQEAPVSDSAKKSDKEEESGWEPTVPPRKEPLRGGMDRPSGGEQFGLKW